MAELDKKPVVTKVTRFRMGGYGNLGLAQAESLQFPHPRIFQDRSIVFPKPMAYKVNAEITSAQGGEWEKPPNPINTHYVEFVVKVTGEEAAVANWLKDTFTRLSRYADQAERLDLVEPDDSEDELETEPPDAE